MMLRKTLKPMVVAIVAATLAPTAMADLNVDLRTFYFNRDFSEGVADKREALSQALRVDYQTKANDALTFGASLFANAKLHDGGDSHQTGVLTSDDGSGYAKLGQLYADYAFNESASVRVGRWVVNTPLLNDSDSRATPSSTQAIKLSGSLGSAEVYALYSDRASSKTGSSFKKYTDSNGDDYGVAIIGGSTVLDNGLSLSAAYGNADGYTQQLYLNAAIQATDKLGLSLTHYSGEGEDTNAAFDADLTNLVADYKLDNLKLSVSYQTVSGGSGYDYTWGGQDDTSLGTNNAVQIMDFNRQDEDSWQLRADYNVAAIPGLSAMIRHTAGEYTNGANKVDEEETNFELKYKVATGSLEGLNLRMRVSRIEADAYDDINELRLIANYSF